MELHTLVPITLMAITIIRYHSSLVIALSKALR